MGQTNHPELLYRHNAGYVKSTKNYLPWQLLQAINVIEEVRLCNLNLN
jgi:hypothetical protein